MAFTTSLFGIIDPLSSSFSCNIFWAIFQIIHILHIFFPCPTAHRWSVIMLPWLCSIPNILKDLLVLPPNRWAIWHMRSNLALFWRSISSSNISSIYIPSALPVSLLACYWAFSTLWHLWFVLFCLTSFLYFLDIHGFSWCFSILLISLFRTSSRVSFTFPKYTMVWIYICTWEWLHVS